MKAVLLVGTLDTKGTEYAFVRELIHARGIKTLVMDLGTIGAPPFTPDITAVEVAMRGGSTLAAIRERGDRGEAINVMLAGAKAITREAFGAGKFHGVLGLGGGGGTAMITAAMRELPVGVPKVMVSTMASGNTAPYVDVKDITMMYSVVDIAGLNPLSRRILANAAGAIAGMVTQDVASGTDRPLIAATMFGVTTPCVTMARQQLEAAGFDVLVFHATGSGGRAMEGLIDDGWFAGVLDVTTTEWADEVVGGVLSAGPDRLGASARTRTPQVVSVGALDMVNFGAPDTIPDAFRDRRLYRHNPSVTLMRTTADECRTIGAKIAEQLNRSTGPVVVLLPLRGVSMIDREGQPFHHPDADNALFSSLRENLRKGIRLRELDAHINDEEFAHALADELLAIVPLGELGSDT
jgi:uncharacterized protein (UPF0261 family)